MAAHGAFGLLRTTRLHFDTGRDDELLQERVASSSYIAAMADTAAAELLEQVRARRRRL